MTVMVFDIETVPDTQLFCKLNELEGLTDIEVTQAAFTKQRQATEREFLPHYLHQIVAISVVVAGDMGIKVWSLGDEDSDEPELLARFFAGLKKYQPTLVSYNGTGFDLPVIHYRALKHGVASETYWEQGDTNPSFKWNNYINRYHARHYDIMDVLSSYQARAAAPLESVALMLGLPGKMGMKGDKVATCYFDGDIGAIRNYCETDVLNTYVVYLRLLQCQGKINADNFELECNNIREYLQNQDKAHFKEFLSNWK